MAPSRPTVRTPPTETSAVSRDPLGSKSLGRSARICAAVVGGIR
ncbi:hypothetical protein [Cryobacterium sp. TMT1-66-1]|nr:hypothetical protein [Cryobacterium sp. TMT1-66-1]